MEARSALKLLGLLPGVEVADLGSDPRLSRHCTPAAREKLGTEVWDGIITDSLRAAVDAGADTMATLYHGCQRAMCGYEKEFPLKARALLDRAGAGPGH